MSISSTLDVNTCLFFVLFIDCREDGKDGLKFYTDPKFFFERWCNEQRKDIENNIRKKRRRRQKKPATDKGSVPKVPVNTRKNRYQMYADGAEFAKQQRPQQSITNTHISSNQVNQDPAKQRISHSDSIISSTPSDDSGINGQSMRRKPTQGPPPPPVSQGGEPPMNGDVVLRPVRPAPARPPSQQQQPQPPPMNNHAPMMPPPPPPDVPQQQSYLSSGTSGYSSASELPPPPPPPQPVMMNNHAPAQPPQPVLSQPLPNNIPPPPPPPPMGGPAPPPPPPIGGIQVQKPPVTNNNVPAAPPPPPDQFRLPSIQPDSAANPNNTSPVVNSPNKPPPVQASDPRSDLLAAIKEGMKLRKVEVQEEKQRHSEPAPNSVEAILRRRIAVELSSDEDSQVSSDYEAEWSDDD
nr:actin-binding protein WASF2-like [Lytechinus pictus]